MYKLNYCYFDFSQVLDFLFLVQELKEKGNDTDDSEMALINNNNDMEKVSVQEFHVFLIKFWVYSFSQLEASILFISISLRSDSKA